MHSRANDLNTVIICHVEDRVSTEVMVRWLAGFSVLSGIVLIQEPVAAKWRRLRNEYRRSGVIGFLDVILFKILYKLRWSRRDKNWQDQVLRKMRSELPQIPDDVPVLNTSSPNTVECMEFIRSCAPDIGIALCKVILNKSIFSLPKTGVFVLHPGVCPEYRNAHGCFWALANDDMTKVGMSLLKIDEGVDTGPVYEYFTYPFDEMNESHIVIQKRMTLDNLPAIAKKLAEIHFESPKPIDTSGRSSHVWGQPKFSAYLRWRRMARRRLQSRGAGS